MLYVENLNGDAPKALDKPFKTGMKPWYSCKNTE